MRMAPPVENKIIEKGGFIKNPPSNCPSIVDLEGTGRSRWADLVGCKFHCSINQDCPLWEEYKIERKKEGFNHDKTS